MSNSVKYTSDDAIIAVQNIIWSQVNTLFLSYNISQERIDESGVKDDLNDFINDYVLNKSESFINEYNQSNFHDDLDVLELTSTKKVAVRDLIRGKLKIYFDEKVRYELANPDDPEGWAKYLSQTDTYSRNQQNLINVGPTAIAIEPTTQSAKDNLNKTTQELIEQYDPARETVGETATRFNENKKNDYNNFSNSGINLNESIELGSKNPFSSYVSIKIPIFSDVKRQNSAAVSAVDGNPIWMPDQYLQVGNVGSDGPKYFKSLDIERVDNVQSNLEKLQSKEGLYIERNIRSDNPNSAVVYTGTLVLSTYFDKAVELKILESHQACLRGLSIDLNLNRGQTKSILQKYAMQIEYGYQDTSVPNNKIKNMYAMINNIAFNTDLETIAISFVSLHSYLMNYVMDADIIAQINSYITTYVGTGIGTGGRFSDIVTLIAIHYGWGATWEGVPYIVRTTEVTSIERPKAQETAIEYIKRCLIVGAVGEEGGTSFTASFEDSETTDAGVILIYRPTENVPTTYIQPTREYSFVINGNNKGTVRNWSPNISNPLGSFKFHWEDYLNAVENSAAIASGEKSYSDLYDENGKSKTVKNFRDTNISNFYYCIASDRKELFHTNVQAFIEANKGINVDENPQIVGMNIDSNMHLNVQNENDLRTVFKRAWQYNFNEYTYTLQDGINITGTLTVSGDTNIKLFDYINIIPMYPATMSEPPIMHPTAGTFLVLGVKDTISSDFTTTLTVWKSIARMDMDGNVLNMYDDVVSGMSGTQVVPIATTVAYSGGSQDLSSKFGAGDKIILWQPGQFGNPLTNGKSHLYTFEGHHRLLEEIKNGYFYDTGESINLDSLTETAKNTLLSKDKKILTVLEKKNKLESWKTYIEMPLYQHGEIVSYNTDTGMYYIRLYSTAETTQTSKIVYGYAFEEDLVIDTSSPIDRVIKTANEELNYLEKQVNNGLDEKTNKFDGPGNYTKYARDCKDWTVGMPGNNYFANGVAWCGCFIDWLFIKTFDKYSAYNMLYAVDAGTWSIYTPVMAEWFTRVGAWHKIKENDGTVYIPQKGDLVFFWVKKLGRIGHVGIVTNYSNGTLTTIEGNTTGLNNTLRNDETSEVPPEKQGVWEKNYTINQQTGKIVSFDTTTTIEGYGTPNYSIV